MTTPIIETPALSLNLAATYTTGMVLSYPKYGSPKYDGIRAVIIDGCAYSRNMILIPNLKVQAYFADGECDGFDGELISGRHDKDVFKRTSSVVRSINGPNDWHFKVFDVVGSSKNFAGRLQELRERMADLQDKQYFKVSLVAQTVLLDDDELSVFEQECLDDGYEGAMLRNPTALYKNGRATANSQDLLKVKRFEDSEAVVLGWSPLIDKDGLVKGDVMGALQVRDTHSGVTFSIGSGFNAAERLHYALHVPVGEYLTYQFFAQGGYDKPRFPTFKGFRPKCDLPVAG